jgi:hypothetical protein
MAGEQQGTVLEHVPSIPTRFMQHVPLEHVNWAWQVWQSAPPVPHAWVPVPSWHVRVVSQQPFGHVWALQTFWHWPVAVQLWPVPQVPHDAPQPLLPHCLPVQSGVHKH